MTAITPSDWIGRSETVHDHVAREPFDRLSAMLDRAPEQAAIPPMGHLLCFLPGSAQADIGEDGHPKRGGIVPPIDLPMRMAAGSRVSFHAPVPYGAKVRRVSTIANLADKTGRTGRLVFLTCVMKSSRIKRYARPMKPTSCFAKERATQARSHRAKGGRRRFHEASRQPRRCCSAFQHSPTTHTESITIATTR